ncbi:uncharacterized protein LOC142996696 [Genypterus blacodes]|uniref:uncharacterized protein LOC142996696 n=1 Tax=Genypterus blacodes TaxID=154954 RepID=UPI003F75A60B
MKERTWEHRGRFSVYSDPTRNSLTVTIRDLTEEDEITEYRCRVDVPNWPDDHYYLNLRVLNGEGFVYKYPQNEEHNVQSFCKEDENLACYSLISARPGSITETNRFALSDDKEHQVYTVTITDLTKDDAGKYWCAMQRTEDDSIAYLTQVDVRIMTGVSSVTGYRGRPVTINCAHREDVKTKGKYFCVDPSSSESSAFEMKPMKASTWEHRGRFSVYSDPTRNSLKVTIRDLTDEDEETKYRCSVDVPNWPDDHYYLNLRVLNGEGFDTHVSRDGYLGSSLTIQCKYPQNEEHNDRSFCKEDENLACISLISARPGSITETNRFALSDDKEHQVYTVNITDLTKDDAGKYWCAMQRTEDDSIAYLTQVDVRIMTLTPTSPTVFISDSSAATKSLGGTESKQTQGSHLPTAPVTPTVHQSNRAGVSSVTGYRGRPVTINCAYKEDVKTKDQYFSVKSYWTGSSAFEIKPMKERTWEHSRRFSVYSDPTSNSLKVTIRDLTDEDKETKYRCSVDVPNGFEDHDYLNLTVLNGEGFDTHVSRDGYLGSSLTIQCKYPQNEEHNVQSFCKEDENLACISLISARPGSITKKIRFALSDDKEHQVYTVNITDLTKDDAGKYWCAMQRTEDDSIAYLTQVDVRIMSEGFDTHVSRDGYLGSSLTIQCKYPQNEEHNVRSFCKDENLACYSLISARPGSITKTNRFALSDDKEHQVYTVNITDLTKDDAGKYWCAMQRTEDDSIAYLTQVDVRIMSEGFDTHVSRDGYLGSSLTIQCKYPQNEEHNDRSFCKEDENLACISLISARPGSITETNRFALSDDKEHQVYTVNITDLTKDDAGKYWCAMQRTEDDSIAYLTQVDVRIMTLTPTSPTVLISDSSAATKSLGGTESKQMQGSHLPTAPVTPTVHQSNRAGVSSVTGYRGRPVTINCAYKEDGKTKGKYFSVDPSLSESSAFEMKPMKERTWEHRGRFSVYSDPTRNSLKVTIRDLTDEDEITKYRCSVNVPNWFDDHYYLNLRVLNGEGFDTNVSRDGYLGSSLTIQCKYPQNEGHNVRSFCKEDENLACISLISARPGSTTKKTRFALSDDKEHQVYTVNITDLTKDDAGKYWCAMQRTEDDSIAYLTQVDVRIMTLTPTSPTVLISDSSAATKSLGENESKQTLESLLPTASVTPTVHQSNRAGVSSVTGYRGRPVTINCAYKEDVKTKDQYFSVKSYWTESSKFEIKPMKERTWEHSRRFSVYSDPTRNSLKVTIRDLTDEDEKTKYRCSVDIPIWPDDHYYLNLTVSNGEGFDTNVSRDGYLGSSLTIQCKYPQNEEHNDRSFCKEDENLACISLISARPGRITKTNRFALSDDKEHQVYTVNITDLTKDDAGKYWCAMQRTEDDSIAYLTQVDVRIMTGVSSVTGYRGRPVTINCAYKEDGKTKGKYFSVDPSSSESSAFEIKPMKERTWEHRGRFSVYSDPTSNSLKVTIRDLTDGDEITKYHCSVDVPNWFDDHYYLNLRVLNGEGFDTHVSRDGYLGSSLTIQCKYPQNEEHNDRSFCKEDENLACISLISARPGSTTKTNRFALSDDKEHQVYTVNITDLTKDDAGKYWCAMQRTEDDSIAYLTQVDVRIMSEGFDTHVSRDGYLGSSLTIQCKYPQNEEHNDRSFCKEDENLACISLISARPGSTTKTNRFALSDDKEHQVYTVNITDLTKDDAGKYWCAMQRTEDDSIAYLTQVDVRIMTLTPTSPTVLISDSSAATKSLGGTESKQTLESLLPTAPVTPTVHQSNRDIYVAVSLSLTFLLILNTLLIIYLRKISKTSGTHPSSVQAANAGHNTEEDNNVAHDYEVVGERRLQEDSGNAPPPTPETQRDSRVYSTATFHTLHCKKTQ